MIDHAAIATIMASIRALHVRTDADTDFKDHLDRLLDRDADGRSIPKPVHFGPTGETRGILVVDAPGSGKTTVVSRGLRKHPAFTGRRGAMAPYLISSVPTEPSLKSMAHVLLAAAGYTLERSRRNTWELFEQLRALMARNGQVVLWIDEAHDLFCRDQDKILRATKSLMQNEGSVIVILSGTERLREVVASDPQVQRRFSVIRPRPLNLSVDHGTLLQILEDFCKRAGLTPAFDETLVPRLVLASRERFGRAVEMMGNAVEQALLEGDKELSSWHFGLAWGMQEGPDAATNPFMVDDWRRFDPDRPTVARAARGGRRKKMA
jgi:type II secretory pathway predicted ATPase ExeA